MPDSRHPGQHGDAGFASMATALSLVALAGFAALAVDYGYLHMKRSQLQTAADAAALAGAAALLSYHGKPEAIRSEILTYARRNLSPSDLPELAARDGDVSLYRDGAPNSGDPNQVEITLGLTRARGNPVRLFLAAALGIDTADVEISSRAGLFSTGGARCLKPWAIPAKFTWDDACDPNKKFKGNGVMDRDSACERASVQVQGWGHGDAGLRVTLKEGDPNEAVTPSQYGAIDYPPVNRGTPQKGGSTYRENIEGCTGSNNTLVRAGDEILLEPGNKQGPTKHGVDALMALDPEACWNDSTRSIEGSAFQDPMASPRVAVIPCYDPATPPQPGRSTVFVHQLAAFFIEGVDAKGNVTGRLIEAVTSAPGPAGEGNLTYSIRLVRDTSRGGGTH